MLRRLAFEDSTVAGAAIVRPLRPSCEGVCCACVRPAVLLTRPSTLHCHTRHKGRFCSPTTPSPTGSSDAAARRSKRLRSPRRSPGRRLERRQLRRIGAITDPRTLLQATPALSFLDARGALVRTQPCSWKCKSPTARYCKRSCAPRGAWCPSAHLWIAALGPSTLAKPHISDASLRGILVSFADAYSDASAARRVKVHLR